MTLSSDLEKYFRYWYENVWMPWIPPKSYWHFYRIQKFDGAWHQLKENIRTPKHFKKILLKHPWTPRHLYFSVLRWLHPQDAGSKNQGNYCLGGPLVFDLDIVKDFSYESMKVSKEYLLRFVEFLIQRFRFQEFSFVFSGRKGFHIYVNDFDPSRFSKKTYNNREELEKKVRKKIAESVQSQKFQIDIHVTEDTKRIIRLPSTLHGETALKCTLIGSKIKDIENFDMKSSVAFSLTKDVSVYCIKSVSRFKFLNEEFGPYTIKSSTTLPEQLALYLTCKGLARIEYNY